MKAVINDGGPAFPVSGKVATRGMHSKTEYLYGMSLRDYLAAKAMAGILSSANWGDTVSWLPQKAYAIADAMLAARKEYNT